MWSGYDRVEVTGKVARGGVMGESVVAESGEHEGAIGVDLGARGDDLTGKHDLIQAAGQVGELQPRSTQTATGEPLDGDGDRRLLGCPARLAVAAAAQEALVEFDHAAEQLAFGAHHGTAQLVQPRPCGLIGTEPESILQTPRRHPVLLRSDEPDRGEPGRQRRM